jgi:uncharacterized protein (DUF2236 family)
MPAGELDDLDTSLLAQGASVFTVLSGTANVVMQLSRPEIGYAVRNSVVTEGNLFTNPRRRSRTTAGFLAAAVLGTAAERAAYRRATNRSHSRVPDAFDADLQRWVEACIYRGFEESRESVYGPLAGAEREEFYRQGAIFGAMLQMPAALWPSDRAAFEAYWNEGLARSRIDPVMREYLHRIVRLDYLNRRVPRPVVRLRYWLTTGHLPPELRAAMGLEWSRAQQRRFQRFNSVLGGVVRRLPASRRAWPLTRSIADHRSRLAAGEDLFGR